MTRPGRSRPRTIPGTDRVSPALFDLSGALDLHVHGGPDVVARRHTDIELAARAGAAGMRAIVLKSHHESTVGRAALAFEATGFPVYGGLVLNTFNVGHLNPEVIARESHRRLRSKPRGGRPRRDARRNLPRW